MSEHVDVYSWGRPLIGPRRNSTNLPLSPKSAPGKVPEHDPVGMDQLRQMQVVLVCSRVWRGQTQTRGGLHVVGQAVHHAQGKVRSLSPSPLYTRPLRPAPCLCWPSLGSDPETLCLRNDRNLGTGDRTAKRDGEVGGAGNSK